MTGAAGCTRPKRPPGGVVGGTKGLGGEGASSAVLGPNNPPAGAGGAGGVNTGTLPENIGGLATVPGF